MGNTMTNQLRNVPRRNGGFTLIELLVVVAIIALLIGVLLPALGKARQTAYALVSSNLQRQLAIGVAAYGGDADSWIPGRETSGFKLRDLSSAVVVQPQLDQKADAPVQSFDWMTPAVGDGQLPADREARMWQLFEQFADPAMNERNYPWVGGQAGTSEAADYADSKGQGYRGVSFLMPGGMMAAGSSEAAQPGQRPPFIGYPMPWRDVAEPVRSYRPRLDRIGASSKKLCTVTAFRYSTSTGLDFDASITGGDSFNSFGSFTCNNAVTTFSSEFAPPSESTNTTSPGTSYLLSYRHSGSLIGSFWDGHAETIEERASRDATLWFPTGYTYRGRSVVTGASTFYQPGQTIN